MQLICKQKLPRKGVERILIRGTNWIGDAVMTLASLSSIRKTYPDAKIYMLAKPWVADIYRHCPDIDEVIIFERPGIHYGLSGLLRLTKKLKKDNFHMAILLQNAIQAAIIAVLAGIPIRAGYNSDARGFLLTNSVKRTKAVKEIHQMNYYLEMVKALGCDDPRKGPYLRLNEDNIEAVESFIMKSGIDNHRKIIGIAPGATYGPAKKWFPERFAVVADRLQEEFSAQIILFGSDSDRETANLLKVNAKYPFIDFVGKTNLRMAISLIAKCSLFISNDSGLMHVAGALNIATLAIFGSTNPVTTSPIGDDVTIIYKGVDCSPCLKESCPTDFRCMNSIGIDEVYQAAKRLLCKNQG